jgi:hypothetical protein
MALVATVNPLSAHVTVGIETLNDATLTYRAPVEPAFTTLQELEAHHTQELVVNFPAGFLVKACHETADYSCTHTVDQVTWTRRPGSTNYGLVTINGAPQQSPFGGLLAVEYFDVDVRTPGIGGTYLTAATQFYSDDDFVDPCQEPTCVEWKQASTSDPRPAPQIRVNGPGRAPEVAFGVFEPLSELGAGTPCPQEIIDDAIRQGIDPGVHCGHFGFEPPAGAPAPPAPPGPELDIRGTATLVRGVDFTTIEVVVTGLQPGLVYSAHLHEGTCANVTSPHYRNDPAGLDAPPNELWPSSDPNNPTAGLIADEHGVARGFGRAEWVARPTARAVWIHEPEDPTAPPPPGGHVHARIACADLV